MSKEYGALGVMLLALFATAYLISKGKPLIADATTAEERNVLLSTSGKAQVSSVVNPAKLVFVPTVKGGGDIVKPYDHETSGLLNYDETVNIEQYREAEPDSISAPPTIVVNEYNAYSSYEQMKVIDARYEADIVKTGEDEHIVPVTTTGKIDVTNVMPEITPEMKPAYIDTKYRVL